MAKEWRYYPDECAECGDELEVCTESEEEGFVFDGDAVRCLDCGATGTIQVLAEDYVVIEWHESAQTA